MKILTLLISLLAVNVYGQSTDSLGIVDNSILNRQETDFLNTSLKNKRDTFSFSNKKIAFVTGSTGTRLISKRDYFLNYVRPWTDEKRLPQIFFVPLSKEEKQKSNGYDAIVMSWVKVFTDKQKKKLIERLSKTSK